MTLRAPLPLRCIWLLALLLVAITFVGVACGTSDSNNVPPPVEITPLEYPFPTEDPFFQALPGATAEFGTLNDSVFQIEVPDDWNGELVLYFRGGQFASDKTSIEQPRIREHLIQEGYAWATSSYDETWNITHRAADHMAALWDYFTGRHGRPSHTYAYGGSMGGGGVLSAAEHYSDRIDGALAECAIASTRSASDLHADMFAIAAYAAGYTAGDAPDFASSPNPGGEAADFFDSVWSELKGDPPKWLRFIDIWLSYTGGRRPLDLRGFELREGGMRALTHDLLLYQRATNSDHVYTFDESLGIDDKQFNRDAVRVALDPIVAEENRDETFSGSIKIPVLLVHTSGDGIVPLSQMYEVINQVKAKGRAELLRYWVYAAPAHCDWSETAEISAFEAVVRWVETGEKPKQPTTWRIE